MMTVDVQAPDDLGTEPLFLQPSAKDAKPRTVQTPKMAKPEIVDPEAPFGWMVDRATGETRPRKSAGRQVANRDRHKAAKTVAPPRSRPAAKPRTAKTATSDQRTYADKISGALDTLWMLTGLTPVIDQKAGPVDLRAVTTKVKAQGTLIRDHADNIVRGLAETAENSDRFGSIVDKFSSEEGAGWILTAALALLPFGLSTLALWQGRTDAEELAKRNQDDWQDFITSVVPGIEAEQESARELAALDQASAPVSP